MRKKLEMLKETDEEALQNWLEQTWTEHNGEACAGINWDILTLEEAKVTLHGKYSYAVNRQYF